MKVRLLGLAAMILAMACRDTSQPTGPTPVDPSMIISDGAHGGNPDFFFLPPLVKNPVTDPNYQVGHFNSTLQPVLTVEVCLLQAAPFDAQGLPVVTDCVAGPPLKKFAAGTVQLLNPPDGQYQVVWKTSESNLDPSKYYRIKVLVQGSTIPFGVADVDPVLNMKEFKNARTSEVIPLNDDSSLPIKFRIENGGGPTLCGTALLCTSTTVTNNSPTGSQIVTVDGGAGAIAGAKFPNGWLPTGPGRPQSVVVTISQVDLGVTDPATGAETTPCHPTLALQQFPGCFKFTTTPALLPIDESGRQFATPVTAAVCYSLVGKGDQREQYAEMYASGPNEPPHALPDVSDAGILSPATRDCSTGSPVITLDDRNSLTRLASLGWRKVKSGVGELFGVKTAYAVDAGLGGLMEAFSNVGPAISATVEPVGDLDICPNCPHAVTFPVRVRVEGSNHHDGEHQNSIGLGGIPVTFTVAAGNGHVGLTNAEGATATQLTAISSAAQFDIENPASTGYATMYWTVPNADGVFRITASSPAFGGPLTFVAIIRPPNFITVAPTERRMLSMQTGASTVFTVAPPGGIVSMLSSNEDTVQVGVHASGEVTALTGGENINAGADASITSVLNNGNAGPSFLVNSFTFQLFPRVTTLVWNPVDRAASYDVVTEFGNASATNPFCTVPTECGIWTPYASTTTNALTYTFEFVGQQPGRWRVTARDARGAVISTTPYIYFAYIN